MLSPALVLALASLPTPAPSASPSPRDVLFAIRDRFLSHRPPPPFETYTLVRKQNTDQGYPDYEESYSDKVWFRSSDDAALKRRVFIVPDLGQPTFDRPAFNEDRDPGPPTANVFQPAPIHPHPVTFVPTPEPQGTPLPTIATIVSVNSFDYVVDSISHEGDELHLIVHPRRDPDRNRLREIWADAKTLELRKIVATDKLFEQGGPVYPVLFTITVGELDGYPIVTKIHGVVGGGYSGDGEVVDYTFEDIAFPKHLPSWYFDPRAYGAHANDLPH